jgi:hypothetical protein
MNDPALKSPTCEACAHKRSLIVPGGIHTVSGGRCANCKQDTLVSPASDWHRPGTGLDLRTMD